MKLLNTMVAGSLFVGIGGGCVRIPEVKPPVVHTTQETTLVVKWEGTAFSRKQLYVCGFVDVDLDMHCITYENFMHFLKVDDGRVPVPDSAAR